MAKCPYCEKPVSLTDDKSREQHSLRKEVKGFLKKEVMYICPHCERVLGISFFFGGFLTGRP